MNGELVKVAVEQKNATEMRMKTSAFMLVEPSFVLTVAAQDNKLAADFWKVKAKSQKSLNIKMAP